MLLPYPCLTVTLNKDEEFNVEQIVTKFPM